MRQQELQAWLCDGDEGPTAADIAVLGADVGSFPPAATRSIAFVLAALRDMYSDDEAVWRWLRRPRPDLAYARAADLLLAGDAGRVETLVTYQWNVAQRSSALPAVGGAATEYAART